MEFTKFASASLEFPSVRDVSSEWSTKIKVLASEWMLKGNASGVQCLSLQHYRGILFPKGNPLACLRSSGPASLERVPHKVDRKALGGHVSQVHTNLVSASCLGEDSHQCIACKRSSTSKNVSASYWIRDRLVSPSCHVDRMLPDWGINSIAVHVDATECDGDVLFLNFSRFEQGGPVLDVEH